MGYIRPIGADHNIQLGTSNSVEKTTSLVVQIATSWASTRLRVLSVSKIRQLSQQILSKLLNNKDILTELALTKVESESSKYT